MIHPPFTRRSPLGPQPSGHVELPPCGRSRRDLLLHGRARGSALARAGRACRRAPGRLRGDGASAPRRRPGGAARPPPRAYGACRRATPTSRSAGARSRRGSPALLAANTGGARARSARANAGSGSAGTRSIPSAMTRTAAARRVLLDGAGQARVGAPSSRLFVLIIPPRPEAWARAGRLGRRGGRGGVRGEKRWVKHPPKLLGLASQSRRGRCRPPPQWLSLRCSGRQCRSPSLVDRRWAQLQVSFGRQHTQSPFRSYLALHVRAHLTS